MEDDVTGFEDKKENDFDKIDGIEGIRVVKESRIKERCEAKWKQGMGWILHRLECNGNR